MRKGLKNILRAGLRTQSEPVRAALRNLWFELQAARIARRAAGSFRQLQGRRNLKVHVGAGDDIRPGWVNIDLTLRGLAHNAAAAQPDTVCINYDLRRGLPLAEGSCAYIYSSHFFEHLAYQQGLRLMRDCHRALQPGGTFRIALPHFRNMFAAYLRKDDSYFDLVDIRAMLPEVEPETLTLVDQVNYGIYQAGEHKCVYDEEKVVLLLRKLGYRSVVPAEYEAGIDPASPLRRKYSFYVEAVK